jgi:hypothetical protein
MRSLVLGASCAAALVVSACSPGQSTAPSGSASLPSGGSTSPSSLAYSVLPVPISSERYVGDNRFLFSFLDPKTNQPVAQPDRPASVSAYPSSKGPESAVSGTGTFMWSIPDEVGIYRAPLAFSEPGEWKLEFTTAAPGGPSETIPFTIDVKADPSAVQVGEAAPSIQTPTLDDVGGEIARISSDSDPVPAYYETSVDEALAAGEPFLLVFATPAFCTSRACGPLLETVKAVTPDFPSLTVVNVEPYVLEYTGGKLQPVVDAQNRLQPVEALRAYGLLSEPWALAIDGSGTVSASLEGVTDEAELRAAIEAAGG